MLTFVQRRGLQVGHINGPDYCMLPQYADDLNRDDTRRNLYKRSANQIDDTYLPYPKTIFKPIDVSIFIKYIIQDHYHIIYRGLDGSIS